MQKRDSETVREESEFGEGVKKKDKADSGDATPFQTFKETFAEQEESARIELLCFDIRNHRREQDSAASTLFAS